MKMDSFALSISHDSYQVFTGGIQTFILDEISHLEAAGVSHVHACPIERLARLLDDSEPLDLLVSVDGMPLALALGEDFASALRQLKNEGRSCRTVLIHHAINWNLNLVDELLEISGTA